MGDQDLNNSQHQQESFLKQYLSIDERKSSTLQICLVVCLLFAGVNYIRFGDITANLATIITAIIYAIAGINASNILGNYMNRGNGINTMNTISPMNTMSPMNNQQMTGLNNGNLIRPNQIQNTPKI